jgi:adenylate kinase family enzyme
MKTCRIHIMGASGSGTTTLGRALADRLAVPHHDTDDYFWLPTNPPFRERREVTDRLRLMEEIFLDREGWVLSGSLDGWGSAIVPYFDLAIFLSLGAALRLARLRQREANHFGRDAVSPGGWRHRETEEFLDWASHYDDGTREGRHRARHEAWLATLPCPVLRLDAAREIDTLVKDVVAALGA